ncbi:MAG: 50S ribosomal protein L22 [Candidatus Diapherotrites archaeon CG08_land_8_20_14_0_20_34_12]|nr:MAG: 50S ribosomal protein L22 [Candidatus Diapherotrites archaeon CG08_land_8_20_14_0_20_34_12]
MVKENYQAQIDGKRIAKAMAKNAPVSTKFSVELCHLIRGWPVSKAEALLNRIVNMEACLPLRIYHKKVGHRKGKGLMAGHYPVFLAKTWLSLINNVKNNAEEKGLDVDSLVIRHCHAAYGFRRRSMQAKGKIGGKVRRRKSTHIEIIVQEIPGINNKKVKQ